MPKKIRIRKPSSETWKDEYKLKESSGEPKKASVDVGTLSDAAKKSKKKRKKGRIIIRKSNKPGKMNLIDERSATRDMAKEGLEMERLKREKKIGDIIKGLKFGDTIKGLK